ncbi:hypothetical protein [Bacillus sp. CD3-1a]|uniref:hypothetical protein n=1 Tax=Bacillus sp. CD3-1a TaxID=2587158 RepID=UPI00112229C1|nr:hypothetical protein [Bacillus sp. CD3-1a]MDA2474496.1 hypothetical protein [Bacillus cereus]TNO92966.1 hypothetical protein FH038_24615 [Bacillus sp. CD3-1a]
MFTYFLPLLITILIFTFICFVAAIVAKKKQTLFFTLIVAIILGVIGAIASFLEISITDYYGLGELNNLSHIIRWLNIFINMGTLGIFIYKAQKNSLFV